MPTTYAQKQSPAQKKDASSAVSVLDSSSQSESLQRKADMANNAAQRAEAPRPNNTGMPDNLKSGIESLSGFSMDDVRVHYNSSKPATVQALAYTQGTDIHVAPGQEKHLPHEAWHVAQQMAGRVSPTTNINGMPVNDNAALEHEADVMGEKAVTQRKTIQSDSIPQKLKTNAETMQRVRIDIDRSKPEFYQTMDKAIENILNEFYVQAIGHAPYLNENGKLDENAQESDYTMKENNKENNWGNILISEGDQSAFLEGGSEKGGHSIDLKMNIDQCKNLYFDNDKENLENALINKESNGNQTVDSVLLHELGHAYQHYLKIKNKEIKKDPFSKLKVYPLLHDCLFQIYSGNKYSGNNLDENRNRLSQIKVVLEKYYPEKCFVIDLFLEDPRNKAIHELMINHLTNLMNDVGEGAENSNNKVEADNLIMNEHVYNHSKKIPIRVKYKNAVTKNNFTFILNYIKEKCTSLQNQPQDLQKQPQDLQKQPQDLQIGDNTGLTKKLETLRIKKRNDWNTKNDELRAKLDNIEGNSFPNKMDNINDEKVKLELINLNNSCWLIQKNFEQIKEIEGILNKINLSVKNINSLTTLVESAKEIDASSKS